MRYPFATSAIVSDSPSVKPAVKGHLLRTVLDVENEIRLASEFCVISSRSSEWSYDHYYLSVTVTKAKRGERPSWTNRIECIANDKRVGVIVAMLCIRERQYNFVSCSLYFGMYKAFQIYHRRELKENGRPETGRNRGRIARNTHNRNVSSSILDKFPVAGVISDVSTPRKYPAHVVDTRYVGRPITEVHLPVTGAYDRRGVGVGVGVVGATNTSISARHDYRSRSDDSRVSTLLLIILSPFTLVVGRSAVVLLLLPSLSLVLQNCRATNTTRVVAAVAAALILSSARCSYAVYREASTGFEERAGCRTRQVRGGREMERRCARPMGERLRPPVPPSIGRSCGGTDSDRNMASASASE
ncbi:hypothetical protein ALC53_02331 [Atta colombica]|uniref:Uncharacterized protein n=1 Tax=Atta colombica TaxID=520822 RepID=A0A195BSC8_9HYME|nr:hypothetical protein ALC53_02331 [Atta colombica]